MRDPTHAAALPILKSSPVAYVEQNVKILCIQYLFVNVDSLSLPLMELFFESAMDEKNKSKYRYHTVME